MLQLVNPFFLNTVLLGGPIEEKLTACAAAGFDLVELWREDVEAFPGKGEGMKAQLYSLHMGLADYQPLQDFDGAPGRQRSTKRRVAECMLNTAEELGAHTVLTNASTDPRCDSTRVVEDMDWLARAAGERKLRIAYEALAWSTVTSTFEDAWKIVRRVDRENLGVVVDTFHLFARGQGAAALEDVPQDRIFLVQLSDLAEEIDSKEISATSRHHRLLPGQGRFPLAALTNQLKRMDYQGPIGLEVFNDELKESDPAWMAREAMASLQHLWLDAG